jgi:hypothetical protein
MIYQPDYFQFLAELEAVRRSGEEADYPQRERATRRKLLPSPFGIGFAVLSVATIAAAFHQF